MGLDQKVTSIFLPLSGLGLELPHLANQLVHKDGEVGCGRGLVAGQHGIGPVVVVTVLVVIGVVFGACAPASEADLSCSHKADLHTWRTPKSILFLLPSFSSSLSILSLYLVRTSAGSMVFVGVQNNPSPPVAHVILLGDGPHLCGGRHGH